MASIANKDARRYGGPYAISAIVGLFAAHFLGTFNDKVYEMVIALLAVHAAGMAAGAMMAQEVRQNNVVG